MKRLIPLAMALLLAACATDGGSVADKVLADFGLKERPEGYVSTTDRVYENLGTVGEVELKRLNLQERHGTVKFEQEGLRGSYFKEVKVYDGYYPLDARAGSRNSQMDSQDYYGYIEFSYRVYQSARQDSRPAAEAAVANIPTDEEGRETYRYKFTGSGTWTGGKGERAKQ